MLDRSPDWIEQAERDLEHAAASGHQGTHEWACFAAQQAAEKAAQALHLHHGRRASKHMVARLLEELPLTVPPNLVEKGRVLDNFYISTRYPSGHSEGPPFEHYGPLQSGAAIDHAGEVLRFVRSWVVERG